MGLTDAGVEAGLNAKWSTYDVDPGKEYKMGLLEEQVQALGLRTLIGINEVEGDAALFRTLIEKAVERQITLDRAIARNLGKGWKLERIDAVARAILRAGAAELEQRPDIPVAVVIDEYVEIAKSFFEGPEPGFINAALDACARDLRAR